MTIMKYYDEFNQLLGQIAVTDARQDSLTLTQGVQRFVDLIENQHKIEKKLIFIGNGGSAAIASHVATDFFKNGKIRAIAFNDAALLTCVSNDYGYEHVFAKPIEMFANPGDIVVAISSSGKSQNILNAAEAAKKKGCHVVTFSGFEPDNPLSKEGEINFYVPSNAYSHVEMIHHSICHYIFDIIMERKEAK